MKIPFIFSMVSIGVAQTLRSQPSDHDQIHDRSFEKTNQSTSLIDDQRLHRHAMALDSINSKILECLIDPTLPICTTEELSKHIKKISVKEKEIIACIGGFDDYDVCKEPGVNYLYEHFRTKSPDHFLTVLVGCNLRETWHNHICKEPPIHFLHKLGKKHL